MRIRPMMFALIVVATPTRLLSQLTIKPTLGISGQSATDLTGSLLLLAALTLLTFSLVLLHHAVAVQGWVTADDKHAPSPTAGVVVCLIGAGVVAFVSCATISILFDIKDPFDAFFFAPRLYIPAALLASFLPGALAALKLLTAATVKSDGPGRGSASVGAVIAVINFIASIATLVAYVRSYY
jgi:hypothetical protein